MATGEFLQKVPGDDLGAPHWRYRSCPQKFIPQTVREWLRRKRHIEKYPHTQLPYEQISVRDRAFGEYYDQVLGVFREMGEKGNAWLPGQRPT